MITFVDTTIITIATTTTTPMITSVPTATNTITTTTTTQLMNLYDTIRCAHL